MLKVRGVYDGTMVKLLEEVDLPPNSAVEVLVPDSGTEPEGERLYWKLLVEAGLVKQRSTLRSPEQSPSPIPVKGEPVSKTILDERR